MLDVIIPAYNAHKTIGQTIDSIVGQTYKDKIKITIVDDCSEKDYFEFIEKYKTVIDIQEIKLEKNSGPGVARRVGQEKTSNPYLTFIDADDVYTDMLFMQGVIELLESDKNKVVVIGEFVEEVFPFKYSPHPRDGVWVFGKVYRREYLARNKITFTDARSNEDTEFNLKTRMYLKNNEEIVHVDNRIVYLWKFQENSITRRNNAEYSFHDGLSGSIDVRTRVLNLKDIDAQQARIERATFLFYMYSSFNKVLTHRPKEVGWLKDVFKSMVEFWHTHGKAEYALVPENEKAILFNQTMEGQTDYVIPKITLEQFVEFLDKKEIDQAFIDKYCV
jgi:glycosyltransferase involved in cell wall biosynthesis